MHLDTEALHADLRPSGDRVQTPAHQDHEEHDRNRPVPNDGVEDAENRDQDIGEPIEGAPRTEPPDVVHNHVREVETRKDGVCNKDRLGSWTRVDAVGCARARAGLDREHGRVCREDHRRVRRVRVGVEQQSVDRLDRRAQQAVFGLGALGIKHRVEDDTEVAIGERDPAETISTLDGFLVGPDLVPVVVVLVPVGVFDL